MSGMSTVRTGHVMGQMGSRRVDGVPHGALSLLRVLISLVMRNFPLAPDTKQG
jgi:hypothetical protein